MPRDLLGDPYLKQVRPILSAVKSWRLWIHWHGQEIYLIRTVLDHRRMGKLCRASTGNRRTACCNQQIQQYIKRQIVGQSNLAIEQAVVAKTLQQEEVQYFWHREKNTTNNKATLEESNVTSFVLGTDGKWETNPVTEVGATGGLPHLHGLRLDSG